MIGLQRGRYAYKSDIKGSITVISVVNRDNTNNTVIDGDLIDILLIAILYCEWILIFIP